MDADKAQLAQLGTTASSSYDTFFTLGRIDARLERMEYTLDKLRKLVEAQHEKVPPMASSERHQGNTQGEEETRQAAQAPTPQARMVRESC